MFGISRCTVLSASLAAGLLSGALATSPHAQEITLRVGHVLAPTHQFHQGLELAASKLLAATDGRVKMQVFPSSQLGTERDMNVAIRTGGVDMLLASPGGASVHLKELAVLDAPFLFRDNAHWQSVLAGPVGQGWEKTMADGAKVHIAGWFHRGTRHVISRQEPYETLASMAGKKIRVADLPPYPQVFRALGAVPTPIAFAEMYQALQSGTVDGADAPLDTILAQKLFEVSKYVNLVSWSFAAPGPVLISDAAWQKLSEADRKALKEAVKAGSDFVTEAFTSGEEDVKKQLVGRNMVLVTPKDPQAWRDAAAKAIPSLASTWGGDAELYGRIRDSN
jgi:tripartite ATP-independent transporter DctP family solute receptor